MSQITVTYNRLAEVALAVMGQAQIKADDESLALATAARQMLHQIAQGQLAVGEPSKAEAKLKAVEK